MISVGIDVSKGHSTVCIIKPGGEVLKQPFEISHTLEEVLSLVNIIKTYDEEVRVVLETTGHYHWPVVTVLVENDVFVCQVNSLRMKRYCSQSIRRAKPTRLTLSKSLHTVFPIGTSLSELCPQMKHTQSCVCYQGSIIIRFL